MTLASDNVSKFKSVVARNIERYQQPDQRINVFEPSLSEWRLFWCQQLIDLCNPLYLINAQIQKSSLLSVVTNDMNQDLRETFDALCGNTELNYILDHSIARFMISDGILSLTVLLTGITGRYRSPQMDRFNNIWNQVHQLLAYTGFWPKFAAISRKEAFDSVEMVPFPIDKYITHFAGGHWER